MQNEDPEMVDLVQDLAVSTIKVESTIILVTIPVTGMLLHPLSCLRQLAHVLDRRDGESIGISFGQRGRP